MTLKLPTYKTMNLEIRDQVARVILRRPEKANAMNNLMWDEIEHCFHWLNVQPFVRSVVLSGDGKHFCSGLDVEIFEELNAGSKNLSTHEAYEKMRVNILKKQANLGAIEHCRKPVLAAVHGACLGAGLDMISYCDMRYCSNDAYFEIKEINFGVTSGIGGLQRLPKLVLPGLVAEWAYTGRRILAPEAERVGLVNKSYDSYEALMDNVVGIAKTIATKSPMAIRGTKESLLFGRDHSVQDSEINIANRNAGLFSHEDVSISIEAKKRGTLANYKD